MHNLVTCDKISCFWPQLVHRFACRIGAGRAYMYVGYTRRARDTHGGLRASFTMTCVEIADWSPCTCANGNATARRPLCPASAALALVRHSMYGCMATILENT